MDFREFLGLAEALCSGSREAEWRTSVSRAYYAAFHVACDLLRGLGFEVPKAERAHRFVSIRLENSSDDNTSEAGRRLSDLRRSRNHADYERSDRFTGLDAEDAVAAAYWIIEIFDEARYEPVQSRITDVIRAYERDVLKEVTWKA